MGHTPRWDLDKTMSEDQVLVCTPLVLAPVVQVMLSTYSIVLISVDNSTCFVHTISLVNKNT